MSKLFFQKLIRHNSKRKNESQNKKFNSDNNIYASSEINEIDYVDVQDAINSSYVIPISSPTHGLSIKMSPTMPTLKVSPRKSKGGDYIEPWDAVKIIHRDKAIHVKNSNPTNVYEHDTILSECKWYKGCINRQEAEDILCTTQESTFLIRARNSSNTDYVISIKHEQEYVHMIIEKEEGKYKLGLCKDRLFISILDMVAHYQKFPMDVEGVGYIILKVIET